MSTQFDTVISPQEEASAPLPLSWPARYALFGKFVLDFQREELYQDGRRARLQSKVYQALLVLLSRAGDVVTREEVRQRIWPESYLTNLDANVNTAMNKLRQTLGDSPDEPLYIQTIPRRGYCFIAAVDFSDTANIPVIRRGAAEAEPAMDDRSPLNLFTAPEYFKSALGIVGLIAAAMLLGALLTLAWSFVSEKNHRGVNPTKGDIAASRGPSSEEQQVPNLAISWDRN
jgi:DNA-binding winged helix-turn-helix (wHTH) protein